MPLDQGLLKGAQSREWIVAKPPTGATPQWVYTGRDESGLGPIYVSLASISVPPSRETMRALHAAYKGKSNIQLVVGAVLGNQIWIFGPDEKTEVTEPLALDQGCRQLQSALDEPDAIAAYTRLGQFRRSLDTTSLVGVTNSGLFASYHIRENVPKRSDWKESCEKAKPLLALRNEHLIKALGFKSEKTAGNALLLTTGTPQSKAVAILLDETEQFDATSARHTGISPVAFGLNVAARQGVPWLLVLRKDQIRIYPAKDGVGVGQKGQVETYLEIDLAAIDSESAGLLTLIFSADALEPNGTANDLLQGSQLFAAQLGSRLRERIYEHVVPQLSKSVAEHLRDQGTKLDSDGLSLAYRLTLRILFRLLFQAYAEDRGLLPAGRNEGFDANSLKTIAKRIITTPAEQFGKSKTLWFDLVQVWNAIDEGNETWNVPAYNGGLFGTDPEAHPEGALIEKLGIQDDILGSVLQHLLLDISEDNVLAPVDFRSLSVREFGTIYEGLLESSLSVATHDLTVDSKGAWIPASKSDQILVRVGQVYFHSASGERKATGSYFTPSFVVDHLIDRALDPALDAHLHKIKSYLLSGDEAKASREFFDFRVADLAMGSGHFLVAAVDRIESKMRMFLAEKETQVPGINAELHRLAQAAKLALGNDESAVGEIEPAALLRRQIARRCIYGLDVNPLAVELSRLAIWIHTFVPGLPMSSLDHGLVCGNSLTGIGTIDEAIQTLSPSDGNGQISIYEGVITENLEKASKLLLEVANSDEAKKSEVKAATEVAKLAKLEAQPTREIFDAAIAARLGIFDPRNIFDEDSLIEVSRQSIVRNVIQKLNPAHMPFIFPEVFVRENPGFDVLLGNPPWESLHLNEDRWWSVRSPGILSLPQIKRDALISEMKLSQPSIEDDYTSAISTIETQRNAVSKGPFPGLGSGHIDLYQAFAWRNLQLLRQGGESALVLPRMALTSSGLSIWRKELLEKQGISSITYLINTKGWVFPEVHYQYSIALAVFGKTKNSEIIFSGPHQDLLSFGGKSLAAISAQKFESWSKTNSFPMIGNQTALNIMSKFYENPKLIEPQQDFGFKAMRGDLLDKDLFDYDVENSTNQIPVWTSAQFNLWEIGLGVPVALANDSKYRKAYFSKVQSAGRSVKSVFHGEKYSLDSLPFDKERIAVGWKTNATNRRTTIAALIPSGVVTTDAASILTRKNGDEKAEAFLLGILCSIPFDWLVRRWVEMNLTFEILESMPVPKFDLKNPLVKRLIMRSGELAAVDTRFVNWAEKVGVKVGLHDGEPERQKVIFEINAIVAHLFGLDSVELQYIYENFHKNWENDSEKKITLEIFKTIGGGK